MDILIRKAIVIDPRSEHHGKQADILIRKGKIEAVGSKIKADNIKVLEASGAFISAGWIDLGVHTGDPGMEQREDLNTVRAAAMAGGYTAIITQPNTRPVIHSKSEVQYILSNTKGGLVDCYPLGALSENCEGKDITEMLDMHAAGAIAFSDGNLPVQHAGLLLRALQYVKAFHGVIVNHPRDADIAGNGQMHEGDISTSLGMKGIPSLAEELMVQRDIYLAAYTDSKLHLANISTAEAVQRIREAKAKGLEVTASVPAINLAFDEEALFGFDSSYKVLPPLRSKSDIAALKTGIADGTIDLINSNHLPLEAEAKKLEFPYADFGAIGLETTFAVANTHLAGVLQLEALIEKFAIRGRQIFDLAIPSIKKGEPANLTVFDPEAEWTVEKRHIFSRSVNTPFLGKKLKGRVLAVINNDQSYFAADQ